MSRDSVTLVFTRRGFQIWKTCPSAKLKRHSSIEWSDFSTLQYVAVLGSGNNHWPFSNSNSGNNHSHPLLQCSVVFHLKPYLGQHSGPHKKVSCFHDALPPPPPTPTGEMTYVWDLTARVFETSDPARDYRLKQYP